MLKSSKLFLLVALVFLIAGGLLVFSKEVIDINVHDTYFVFTWPHLLFFISTIFFSKALIYVGFEKIRKPIHWMIGMIDVSGVVAFFLSMFWALFFPSGPERYYPENDVGFFESILGGLLESGLLYLILSQLIFFVGAVIALFSKSRKV